MRIKKEESFFLVTFKARTRFVRQNIGSIVGSIVGSIEGLSRVYREAAQKVDVVDIQPIIVTFSVECERLPLRMTPSGQDLPAQPCL